MYSKHYSEFTILLLKVTPLFCIKQQANFIKLTVIIMYNYIAVHF